MGYARKILIDSECKSLVELVAEEENALRQMALTKKKKLKQQIEMMKADITKKTYRYNQVEKRLNNIRDNENKASEIFELERELISLEEDNVNGWKELEKLQDLYYS